MTLEGRVGKQRFCLVAAVEVKLGLDGKTPSLMREQTEQLVPSSPPSRSLEPKIMDLNRMNLSPEPVLFT